MAENKNPVVPLTIAEINERAIRLFDIAQLVRIQNLCQTQIFVLLRSRPKRAAQGGSCTEDENQRTGA